MATYTTIKQYNSAQKGQTKDICTLLEKTITENLPKGTSKIWHGGPVWFLDGNPIVGYWVRKDSEVQLLFWSGQSFKESELSPEGSFKAAEIRYIEPQQVKVTHIKRWLKKAADIQWDYKNIVKRKGVLERIQ